MKITIVSDAGSWKNAYIPGLIKDLKGLRHQARWVHRAQDIPRGDITLIVGFFQIIRPEHLSRNAHNLVVHESALPKGRGWSPMSWQVVEGAKKIDLTLFEAVEKVDAGLVYLRDSAPLRGDELLEEIRGKTIRVMLGMCRQFVARYPKILKNGRLQKGAPSYYRRRTAEDSRLDPAKSLREQFNLLRVVDNEHYPAFFEWRGKTYRLKITKQTP